MALAKLLTIDPRAGTATLQPGVRNLAISEAAAAYGLYYAPDPSSQIACSIGGNVAENSGGVHCLKYGLTVHNVTGLRFVQMDGTVVTLGGQTLDQPGYDLLALLCGSEGMLGVVTQVTVRLLPLPPRQEVLLAAFATVAAAAEADSEARVAGRAMQRDHAASVQLLHRGRAHLHPLALRVLLVREGDGYQETCGHFVDPGQEPAHQNLEVVALVAQQMGDDHSVDQPVRMIGHENHWPLSGNPVQLMRRRLQLDAHHLHRRGPERLPLGRAHPFELAHPAHDGQFAGEPLDCPDHGRAEW